ncbi:hypothetical protein LBMAG56_18300 [Verrucomicrobiota bacterium]|nr:hypothetical protein LBMAG56_18300 [Verrucomicrobiota bacterium]
MKLRVTLMLLVAAGVAAAQAQTLSAKIDAAIAAKAGGPLAERCSDADFVRRIHLDLAGRIPTADEARRFLKDSDAQKRTKLVEQLLAGPDFPRRFEQAITVMLLERRGGGKIPESKWRDYLREQIAKNRPWNEIVRELLAVEGDFKNKPAAKFMADGEKLDPEKTAHDIARLFLGMNLGCAQCHDHPVVEDFKQADFYGIYAYLNQTRVQEDKKTKAALLVEGAVTNKVEFKSVFKKTKEATAPHLPGRPEVTIPVFAKGEEFAEPPADGKPGVLKFRARALLAEELTSADNVQFARNSANRFWFVLMGRGVVHPLDMMHSGNPPSHPELLDALAKEFAAHKFDLRWLLREIALSEAYQRSSRAPKGVDPKTIPAASYRVANLKGLSAEQTAWSVMVATGSLDKVTKAPAGASKFVYKAYNSGTSTVPPATLDDTLQLFTATFGNPPGEPEVEFAPSMGHSLFLMNERLVLGWLKAEEGNLVGRLAKLAKPEEIADELYLSVLARPSDKSEVAEVGDYLAKNTSRREQALGELAWALLASAEFRLNH